jgi:hypothetical protein
MRAGPGGAGGHQAAAPLAAAAALLALAALGGCSHLPAVHMPALHMPWHHHAPPPPAPVHELDITGAAGAPVEFPQYWKRNTLVVDLSAVSGSGAITLTPAAGSAWPVRLALRITPGSIGLLEVRADQRLSLPITPAAGKPVELELATRLYTSRTPRMSVTWGPASAPAP